jgi:phosphatidylinositol glycan class B
MGLTLASPWQWFCSTRTFSNSLEATLTAGALVLFPWRFFLGGDPAKGSERKEERVSSTPPGVVPQGLYPALVSAAAAFYFRPTNIIIWIAISAGLVWSTRSLPKALTLLQAAFVSGTSVIVLFASIDRIYYQQWAFPPLKFLYINLVQSLAVFYGRNRIDYYFTEGLPLLLTTALPFACTGLYRALSQKDVQNDSSRNTWTSRTRSILALASLITVLTLSTIAHKEMRFIYPLLPILHTLAALPLSRFPTTLPRKTILATLLLANIFITYYTSMIHQRGVIDILHHLRDIQESRFSNLPVIAAATKNVSVGFLMPCHSTPWRSHLIYPEIQAWALTCEPPLDLSGEERETYLDEADIFYENPTSWMEGNLGQGKRSWPEFLVFFEQLEEAMREALSPRGYRECGRFFNTQWHDDGRRRGDVVSFCGGGEK